MSDFKTDETLKAKVPDPFISNAVLHLYTTRFLRLKKKPFKIQIFTSVRLINDLFARCSPNFKGKPRYDRVSIESAQRYKRAGLGGEIWFGEIHCLVKIIWPRDFHKVNESLVVVRYIEEVARVRDWVRAKRPHLSFVENFFFNELEIKYKKKFDRINIMKPNGKRTKLTDGKLRLGRPYLMWQPNEMFGSDPYGILSIDTLFKPEHILQDRQLLDDKECEYPCFYVQNTITYFSNLTLTS